MNWTNRLLASGALLAAALVGSTGAQAATTVNLTAQRASLTLPDGEVATMWGYCGAVASGSAGTSSGGGCAANAGGLATWTQGPTLVVPAGDTLTINLNNTLPTPTSVTILGQVGGGLGQPNRVASPVHSGAAVTSEFAQAPATFTPPAQGPRMRSFAPEADGQGGSASYVWNNLKPGTYLYESGSRPSLQVPMGLYGLLIVTGSPGATPVPGGPNVAYGAPIAGSSTQVPLAYDADAGFLFSEVDLLQNAAVDAAAQAMAAAQPPTAQNAAAFAALEQRKLPPAGPGTLVDPGYNPNDPSLPDCSTVACYPPAVNYAPTWFLVNGQSYDPTNPARTAAIVSDALPGAGQATGRVLVRFANAGLKTHIPTIVGMTSLLVGEDGNLLPDVALALGKSAASGTPLVSGKLQSAILLTAAKTMDVVITPAIAADGSRFVDRAFPVIDRELSLSGGGKSFSGLQGFLAIAPAGTRSAQLGGVMLGGTSTPILPAAVSAAANNDTFRVPAGATTFSGNVLDNDVGISQVAVAANGDLSSGTLVLGADGRFTVSGPASAGGVIQDGATFTYTGLDGNGVAHSATATFLVTHTDQDTVTGLAQTFNSQVASLVHVPHPGVLSGAASSGNYTLQASASAATPAALPAAGQVLPFGAPACSGPGKCSVQLFADGSFTATASVPGTYTFPFYVVDAQGKTPVDAHGQPMATLATVVFPSGSGVSVNLQDSVTGTSAGTDYRWVIEEDQTYLHDPGNAGFVPPAFAVPLTALHYQPAALSGGLTSPQVRATVGALPANFTGFVAGTYVQIAGSSTDAFNGTFRINAVSGNTFTFTLWQAPPAGATLADSSAAMATSSQSLATNFHRSYMPVVASGCTGPRSCNDAQTLQGGAVAAGARSLPSDVALDPSKRYFLSVLPGDAGDPAAGIASTGHTMGAAPVVPTAPGASSWSPVTVLVPENPLPPGQMSFFVFEDNNPVSGDVDDNEPGLGGFEIVIYDTRGSSGDQAGQMTYDLMNQPLTNALANQGGIGTDGNYYWNLCPTTPNNMPMPVGVIYTCLAVLNGQGQDVSPYTGMALVKNVIPGRIDVQAHPAAWREAAGETWIQVSTLEGTPNNDSFVHAGEPAYWQEFGPPGFHSFIGFVNPSHLAKANADARAAAPAGSPFVTVSGRVTNLHMDRPPEAKLNNSCQPGTTDPTCARAALNYTQCYVALNAQSGNGAAVAFATCDADGNFQLTGVPPDSYELFIWDEWLDQIKAKQLVQVPVDAANGSVVSTGDIPVFNWFTRIQETIYLDVNGNGVRDPGEPGLTNLVANVRFRDGSFSNRLTTDAQGNATHNELFPLFNWYVMENDQTRYKNTGVHVIYDAGGIPDQVNLATSAAPGGEYFQTLGVVNSREKFPVPMANRIPGALYATSDGKDPAIDPATGICANCTTERIDPPGYITEGMQGFINQTEFVEWGKQPFAPGENGGISGMVYFASVRAFDDPRLKVQNLSEPGIPRVQVNLYHRTTNADGSTSDVLVDTTTSTSWDDWANGTGAFGTPGVPNLSCPGNPPGASHPPAYVAGQTDPFINYTLGASNQYKCYDGQHAFNQVQPAPYDGYYAFPTGACTICTQVAVVNNATGQPLANPDGSAAAPVLTLPAGQYVVEVVRPDGFEMTKEEDKNILIGDTWISAAPQQFGSPVNVFILPDQATVNDSNPQGFSMVFPPCVGVPHVVPDFLTVVPEAGQVAPFAGQVRNLCDRKLVTLHDQEAAGGDFQLWTPAPIAGHVTGLMLNDAAAEFDPYSPSFGEKFALPNAPVSVRDFNGVEILRAYTDKWGTFDFLNVSTWEANVPNPSGYAPNMLTYCMNDPGPTPVAGQAGKFQVDPYYNSQYSDFCYNWPILPGITTYLDTPVLPISAFASHYAPVDCQYADTTPAVLRVDGNWVPTPDHAFLPPTVALPGSGTGPYVDQGSAAPAQLTIIALGDTSVLNPAYAGPTALPGTQYAPNRITRHYGFGASAGDQGSVRLVAASGQAWVLPVKSWGDLSIVASVPASGVGAVPVGDYQLIVTAANGKSSIDTVTVTVDNSKTNRNFRAPYYVGAPVPGTGIGSGQGFGLPHPIQDAIDNPAVLPGDLVIVDAGTYPELAVMWKPLRLQGVGAAAVTIQATKYPNSKIADWRNRINLLFGLMPDGNPFVDAGGNAYPTQIDPLPGQEITGGITRLEPSALSTEEGAGITVLAANNQVDPTRPRGCLSVSQLKAMDVQPEQNFTPASPYGFFPLVAPGANAPVNANQPVAATARGRYWSDFACYAARIDGIGVTGSDAGGGIYVNGWAHNLQISNNRVFGNSGPYAGGVRVGQPYLEGQVANQRTGTLSYNQHVVIHHNAIFNNGTDEANAAPGNLVGTSGAGGGLAIEAGSDNFAVTNNWICGNFSAGDGGGMGVVGNSTPGLIRNNSIVFNESYQQTGPSFGGGLAIEGEPPAGTTASTGVGNIVVDANLVQGNSVRSGSGGGVRLAAINGSEVDNRGHHWSVSLTNNVIVNNVAGWAGAGVSLADAAWVTLLGNTIANNDAVGVAGTLMNTQVGTLATGPATAVPGPSGVASDPDSQQLLAILAQQFRPRRGAGSAPGAPASLTISQPATMSNNIVWHNRSFFFDASSGTAKLCASNRWSDAASHTCVQLAQQTATGQCDTSNAAYWDVGVVGDQSAAGGNTRLVMDHSILSSAGAYATTVNGVSNGVIAADPAFTKGYCNGGRVNPGAQFEPGSPFQPAFGINAAATLDESGNYVDLSFGPLSLNDPASPASATGNYHLAGASSPAVDAGATPTTAVMTATGNYARVDFDGTARPQGKAYDIGADEFVPPYVDVAVTKDDGVTSVAQGGTTTYTMVVSNSGSVAVSGVGVSDVLPGVTVATSLGGNGVLGTSTQKLTGTWTCTANTSGASCGAQSGTGDIATTVNLPAVGSVTFTMTVAIPANAMSGQGITNTVRATVPAGVNDINAANNVASDTDTVSRGAVDLSIAKVFTGGGATARLEPGQAVSYTLTVRNLGAIDAWFTRVSDAVPGLLTGVSWTCVASTGSNCGAASGTGSIAVTTALVAAQGTLTYTLTGTVPFSAQGNSQFSNTASVGANSALYTDPVGGNNSASATATVSLGQGSLSPDPAYLSPTQTGQSSQVVVTVRNTGTGVLTLGSPSLSGNPQFSLAGSTCVAASPLAAGATCTVTVQFAPNAVGTVSSSLSLPTGAGTLTDLISGQGTPPVVTVGSAALSVAPNPLALTSVPANFQVKTTTLQLSNSGTATLQLNGVTVGSGTPAAGSFSVSNGAQNPCPTSNGRVAVGTLAPGASCNLTVRYTPSTSAGNSGTLTIATPGATTASTPVTLTGN